MRCLKPQETNAYLSQIGMKIGNWNEIIDVRNSEIHGNKWLNYQAPKNAQELFCFSQHIAGWLPKGNWKILQIDNSNSFDPIQSRLFGSLLFDREEMIDFFENRTFLFEYDSNESSSKYNDCLISYLVNLFLLFECHCYMVSENSLSGQCLSIQDGFVYFSSRCSDIAGAEYLLKNFEINPLMSPQWVVELIAEDQTR